MSKRTTMQRVASSTTGQANGIPVRVNGQDVAVMVVGPAALGGLEGSLDKRVWVVAKARDNPTASTLNTLTSATVAEAFERFEWVRPFVALDATGPRNFDFVVTAYEQE